VSRSLVILVTILVASFGLAGAATFSSATVKNVCQIQISAPPNSLVRIPNFPRGGHWMVVHRGDTARRFFTVGNDFGRTVWLNVYPLGDEGDGLTVTATCPSVLAAGGTAQVEITAVAESESEPGDRLVMLEILALHAGGSARVQVAIPISVK